MILLITIITILSGALGYFIYRAYILAGILADTEDYITDLEDISVYMFQQIKDARINMQEIDRIGAFEEDDEAGTTFAMLKEVVDNLDKEFNGEKKEKIK
jgi:hypothetical protein